MAKDEEPQEEENAELTKLQKSIKTNRTVLFSLLVCSAVIISILVTCVLVINMQLSNRKEIPSEEFAELLLELDTHLKHLSAIHNSEAKVYFEFQDSLGEIQTLYQHDNINTLRDFMIAQEKDKRKLMDLMASGNRNLASMLSGSRAWVQTFEQQVANEKKKSQARETKLVESKKTDELIDDESASSETK